MSIYTNEVENLELDSGSDCTEPISPPWSFRTASNRGTNCSSTTAEMSSAISGHLGQGHKLLPVHSIQDGHCTCGVTACKSPGKHPFGYLVHAGHKDASRDSDQIQRWFSSSSSPMNLGVVCGSESRNLLVLDQDSHEAGEILDKAALPITRTEATGRGRHLFFHVPDLGSVEKWPSVPGLDIKTNGYVVAYPSRHVSGTDYTTNNEPIAELSKFDLDQLYEFLNEHSPTTSRMKRNLASTIDLGEYEGNELLGGRRVLEVMAFGLRVGERDKGFIWLIGKYAAVRLTREQAIENLKIVWERTERSNEDPYPWAYVEKKMWKYPDLLVKAHGTLIRDQHRFDMARYWWTPKMAETRRSKASSQERVARAVLLLDNTRIARGLTVIETQKALRDLGSPLSKELACAVVRERKA